MKRYWYFTYDADPEPWEDWSIGEFILLGTRKDAHKTVQRLNKKSDGLWNFHSVEHDVILGPGDALQYNKQGDKK